MSSPEQIHLSTFTSCQCIRRNTQKWVMQRRGLLQVLQLQQTIRNINGHQLLMHPSGVRVLVVHALHCSRALHGAAHLLVMLNPIDIPLKLPAARHVQRCLCLRMRTFIIQFIPWAALTKVLHQSKASRIL